MEGEMGKFTTALFALPISFFIAFLILPSTLAFASLGCTALNGKKTDEAEISGSAYGGWFDAGDTITASSSGTTLVGLPRRYKQENHHS
jgi:hypothetical protein